MAFPVNLDATWVNTASYDPGELRRADAAMFAGDGTAFGVPGGIVRHGDTSLAVTVDGSDNVTIQAGAVVIPGNAVAGTGPYRFALGAASTNALTARNATNPRIDLVVARAMDTDVVGTHGAYTGRLDVIAGTPAATPGVPTLPSMAVELARVTVPATGGGSSSVDTSHRTYATAIGGTTPVASASLLPATAAKWDRFRALDTGVVYEWSGSAMGAVAQMASGSTTMSDGGAAPSTRAISFPTNRFTTAPVVTLTHGTGATSSTTSNIWVSGSITTSGFTAAIARSTTTTVTVYWTAVSAP